VSVTVSSPSLVMFWAHESCKRLVITTINSALLMAFRAGMLRVVNGVNNQLQVLQTIVCSVAIDVVYMVMTIWNWAVCLFPHVTMFKNGPSALRECYVATSVDASCARLELRGEWLNVVSTLPFPARVVSRAEATRQQFCLGTARENTHLLNILTHLKKVKG